MRKDDIDYISNQTRYSTSLLVSLGYKLEEGKKGVNRCDDLFKIYDEDGVLLLNNLSKSVKIHHKRKEFFPFAKKRHKTLRWQPMERKIECQID